MAVESKYRVLAGLGESDSSKDTLLSIFINQAEKKVIRCRHPFGATDTQKVKALSDYSDNVEEIFTYLYNKRGAEGETAHSEGGVSRSYENAGIPSSFTADILPFVDVW